MNSGYTIAMKTSFENQRSEVKVKKSWRKFLKLIRVILYEKKP